jgi:hypothetical protein
VLNCFLIGKSLLEKLINNSGDLLMIIQTRDGHSAEELGYKVPGKGTEYKAFRRSEQRRGLND